MSAIPAEIECLDLRQTFGRTKALDGTSFTVRPGEIFGLLGPNGAGKTTTIRILATLLPPDAGTARVAGLDVRTDTMAVRRLLGYVPQQLSADGALTGYENVWLFARLYDVPRQERKTRIEEALVTMGLEDARDRLASTYSGGMIRRLELAQALVNQPRGADSGRADRWPRPGSPWRRLGTCARPARGNRHDRAPHHALYGRSRFFVRQGCVDAPWSGACARHAQ